MKGIDQLVGRLENLGEDTHEKSGIELVTTTSGQEDAAVDMNKKKNPPHSNHSHGVDGAEVDRWQEKADKEIRDALDVDPNNNTLVNRKSSSSSQAATLGAVKVDVDVETGDLDADLRLANEKKLVRMGMNTVLAIAIHNFPEGLATFVATLDDPSVGVSLAVAIAIHNIPEGLCVAIPIYYATGDKRKAFCWALLSGVSEPVGAFLGWLVLKEAMGEVTYAILFGLVGGMMVMICLSQLIPTAHRYDPEDKIVTNCVVLGMSVMALSLVLFML